MGGYFNNREIEGTSFSFSPATPSWDPTSYVLVLLRENASVGKTTMDTSTLGELANFQEKDCIGVIAQIGASNVEVHLGDNVPASVQVGSYVVIESLGVGVFGQITEMSRIEDGQQGGGDWKPQGKMRFKARIQLLTSLNLGNGKVSPGVLSKPRLGDKAYNPHPKLVKHLVESHSSMSGSGEQVTLSLSRLLDRDSSPVKFTPEMMFGRHCAILGTTGGGKSWSVARLVEQCGKLNSKVILFDATGEFGGLKGSVLHVYLGAHPRPAPQSRQVVLPYFQLTESDLFAIFKPTGQSQAPKLRAAIKSLKLARLAPNLALDGLITKANKAKEPFDTETARHIAAIEEPYSIFQIKKLPQQIQNECVFPSRSALETQYYGDINGSEVSQCMPLINRIQDIVQSPNLAPIFDPQDKPSLLEVIDKFMEHPSIRVLCVSLQYLSFAHMAREIIANATGRYLLQAGRDEKFQDKPVLVIVDEAHQFLNTTLETDNGFFPLDSFGLIAKEGRKYALSICIATQRPRDIPESVLSQMGTFIVHRLINDRDRAVVERASGSVDAGVLASLPALAPGQAVVLGVDFPVPLSVAMEAPESPPSSSGPNYQKHWASK